LKEINSTIFFAYLSSVFVLQEPEQVFHVLTEALKDPADFVDFDLPSALKEWKLGYYTPIKRSIHTYHFSKPI
jgi:hypothetical protein